jgi:hypothetical protein
MQCTDIQKHLAIDARLSRLPAGVRAHLLECPHCRHAQAIYAGIDLQLREQPAWQPPPGFAERVGLQGLASMSAASARPRGFFRRIVWPAVAEPSAPILLGLLAAVFSLLVLRNVHPLVAGYPELIAAFSGALLANAIQLAWVTGILSLCFTAWITRRILQ